ncbi:RNA polymerase sigma factor [Asanoa sp. NPDC049518]|uniref:RNA polymerase sigma factor n=1 Tax=unclassified Asanoa TaxID=2685164 RepID=UPI0034268185
MLSDLSQEHEFERLYRRVSRDLYGHALLLVGGNAAVASELVQDTFAAAAEAWAVIRRRKIDEQRAWLFTVLKRKAANSYRSSRREASAILRLAQESLSPRTAGTDPAGVALSNETLDAVWKVIKAMPLARQKVCALLAQGLTTAEIARQLRISQSTVRDHRQRGRAEILRALEPRYTIIDSPSDEVEEAW